MSFDISKAKVGDTMTARVESKVTGVYPNNLVPYITTEYGGVIGARNGYLTDVVFTTPKPPLPTAPGSVIKIGPIYTCAIVIARGLAL